MVIALANEHRQLLTDISTMAQSELLLVLRAAKDMPFDEWAGFFRDSFIRISDDYGSVSELAALTYYDLVREEISDAATTAPSIYVATSPSYEFIDSRRDSGLAAVIAKGQTVDEYEDVLTFASAIMGKYQFNVSRETVIENTYSDPFMSFPTRLPRANACAWCKYMATVAEQTAAIDMNDGFHDDCKCVIVPVNDIAESMIRVSFLDKFKEDYEKAQNQIINGEIEGTRNIKRGTESYAVALRKEISPLARDWRKNFEVTAELTSAQRASQRISTGNKVNEIVDKINSSRTLSAKDKEILRSWGYDLSSIGKPLSGNIDRPTQKNVLSVLRKLYGYR